LNGGCNRRNVFPAGFVAGQGVKDMQAIKKQAGTILCAALLALSAQGSAAQAAPPARQFARPSLAATAFLNPTSQTAVTTSAGDNNGFQGTPTGALADAGSAARADSTTGTPKLCARLSSDSGATWTTVVLSTTTLTTSEATYQLGNAGELWGRAWTANDFSGGKFRVQVIPIASNTSRDFTLDWVAAKIHFN
jgi:hypothetical protein